MNELQDKYTTLVRYISRNGEKFPKKHGNWIKLNLFKDYYLSLDSWNSSIDFQRGLGKYNEWSGFGNEYKKQDIRISHLGIDFGVFKCYNERLLDWLLFDVIKVEKIEKKYL